MASTIEDLRGATPETHTEYTNRIDAEAPPADSVIWRKLGGEAITRAQLKAYADNMDLTETDALAHWLAS